jgi:hypothetical protein
MLAKVVNPWYDRDGRKYIDFEIGGEFINVKVPFRYNRVMCHVDGIRPVQELGADEIVHVELTRKSWEGKIHFVLKSCIT